LLKLVAFHGVTHLPPKSVNEMIHFCTIRHNQTGPLPRCDVTETVTNVNRNVTAFQLVIAGLDPAIHAACRVKRKAGKRNAARTGARRVSLGLGRLTWCVDHSEPDMTLGAVD
jgi:hypothetical protein